MRTYTKYTFDSLMQALKEGDFHLSPSSIKHFASSPRDFVKYKVYREEKPTTDDMKMGILYESFLLDQPHNLKIYSKDEFPVAGKDLRNAVNKAYMDNLKEEFGDDLLVEQTIVNVAQAMADRTKRHPVANSLLARGSDFQKELKWQVNGINLLGYTDVIGKDIIVEIKKCRDASFKKFQYDIYDFDYLRQVAMYWDAEGQTKDVYIIGCDPGGQVCPVEIKTETLIAQVEEYHQLIDSFKLCIELEAFDAGYEWFYEGAYEL